MAQVYLIAGEASGDFLGAKLMKALKEQAPSLTYAGVGGGLMMAEGLSSLFPMEDIALMGIAEIIPHIPRLLRRINETVQHILNLQPQVIVTIDSPGFCLRVVKKLRRMGVHIPVVHYVAPSVWAWRPKRAKRLAGLVDHLLTLFPFEPSYFIPHGLATTFVGHPLMETPLPECEKDPNMILLLPGSRQGEVRRHWPIFVKTAELLLNDFPNLTFHVPTFPHFLPFLKSHTTKTLPIHFSINSQEKPSLFQKAKGALAASGTVSLELAHAHVPMVIAYKVSPFTHFILKKIVHTPYVCLVNILLKEPHVPELLQNMCTPHNLHKAMVSILKNPTQDRALKESVKLLQVSHKTPSTIAAHTVLTFIK